MKCSRPLLALLIAAALLGAAGAEAARSLPSPALLEPPRFTVAELASPAADTAGSAPGRPKVGRFSFLTSSSCSMTMNHRAARTVRIANFHDATGNRHRLGLPSRPGLPPPVAVASWKLASGDFDKLGGANVWETGRIRGETYRPTFQGLWTDPVTGLAYARNRWYDARTASWLSEDPAGAFDSENLYAFVGWQPHMSTDPTGEVAIVDNVVGAVVSVGIGFTVTCIMEGCEAYSGTDLIIDLTLGAATSGLSAIGQLKHLRHAKTAWRFGARVAAEVGLDMGAAAARYEIEGKHYGEDYDLGDLAVGAAFNQIIGGGGALAGRGIGKFGRWSAGRLGQSNSRLGQLLARDVLSFNPWRGGAPGRGGVNLLSHSGDSGRPYIRFNRTHSGARPSPRGRGPGGGRLQSHHPLQREWAEQNLAAYGYDANLAPTVTLETGRSFPHTIMSARQNLRRNLRVGAGQGKWSSTIDQELAYIVGDFRAGGYSNEAIQTIMAQQYRMLDKLGVPYMRPPGF